MLGCEKIVQLRLHQYTKQGARQRNLHSLFIPAQREDSHDKFFPSHASYHPIPIIIPVTFTRSEGWEMKGEENVTEWSLLCLLSLCPYGTSGTLAAGDPLPLPLSFFPRPPPSSPTPPNSPLTLLPTYILSLTKNSSQSLAKCLILFGCSKVCK